jgi:ribosomal protein S3AE
MATDNKQLSMNQKIFKLGLSVENISMYLLCCGLEDEGRKITTSNIRQIWNSTDDLMEQSLIELEKRNIIRKIISDDTGKNIYRLINSEQWA